MNKRHKVALRQELGTLDKQTIMHIDRELYQDYLTLQEKIDEYNENVGLLTNHAFIKNINMYDLYSKSIKEI